MRDTARLPRPSNSNTSQSSKSILSQRENTIEEKLSPTVGSPMTQSSVFFSGKKRDRAVSFYDFKGLIAPVFSCFKYDEKRTLNYECIDRYAAWLKSNKINGVLVNSPIGECYAMTADERRLHAEFWWLHAQKYDLLCMIYIGCAPLPDALVAAKHADEMGVHAVVCSSDVYRQPKDSSDLVRYCSTIAENCRTRPFFYHHYPKQINTGINLLDFYDRAETDIPNFFGIHYSTSELDEGARCLRNGRIVVLNTRCMLAAGLLMGFEAATMTCINTCPQLCFDILQAMKSNDLQTAKVKQQRLSDFIWAVAGNSDKDDDISSWKNWFNEVMTSETSVGFTAGPPRISF